MKQKLKRFMAGFMAMLTLVGTLFTNGTTAFAASPQANIAFWNASVKNSGEVSELKPGYNHGKILYSILDGNSAYCMNFGLRADGGQLMNSYDDASTSMSAQQRKILVGDTLDTTELINCMNSIGINVDKIKVSLKMAYFYMISDGKDKNNNNTEYAFHLEIDTSEVLPASFKLFDINKIGFAIWNTERPKIISQMNLYKPEDLLA